MNEHVIKTFAVVTDVSPSEQLGSSDEALKAMAMLMGLQSPTSFWNVGSLAPAPISPLPLRKWSSSTLSYRRQFIHHARALYDSGEVLYAANVAKNKEIRCDGKGFWNRYMGEIPPPASFNKKGKPRVTLGGYETGRGIVPSYDVLVDDLYVLGWYADSLCGLWGAISDANGEPVRLKVIIDNLPNEQGGRAAHKATLLKEVCRRASEGAVDLIGVVDAPYTNQRDLFVDNLAGLLYSIASSKKERSDGAELFTIGRVRNGELWACGIQQ